jgi:ribonuclease VapC
VIILDSSALIALLEEEPEHEVFKAAIADAGRVAASAITLYETGIVLLRRRGEASLQNLRDLVEALEIEIVPFDGAQMEASWRAYARFGKGIDPAGLISAIARPMPRRFRATPRFYSRATTSRARTSRKRCESLD